MIQLSIYVKFWRVNQLQKYCGQIANKVAVNYKYQYQTYINTKIYQQMSQPTVSHCNQHFVPQIVHAKPKIAFVYQSNKYNLNTLNLIPSDTLTSYNKTDRNLKLGQINSNNNFITPKKVDDKQNNCMPSPFGTSNIISDFSNKLQKNKIGAKETQIKVSNDQNGQLIKKKSSPNLLKYPPLSPRLEGRKSVKCPSFLNQRSKNVQQTQTQAHFGSSTLQPTEEVNCKCGSSATHQVKQTQQKCCSKCGISKMIGGLQLLPLSSYQNLVKTQRGTHGKLDQTLKSLVYTATALLSPHAKTLDEFIKNVNEQKRNIQKYYKDHLECEGQNINTFYKERRLQLKSHYQKIKAAIKESIEEDLNQIQILQNQQMEEWKKSIISLEEDLRKLQVIQKQAKSEGEKTKGLYVRQSIIEQYQQILAKPRNPTSARGSKIQSQTDTMSISAVSNTSSNISVLCTTVILKNFNVNAEMYKPNSYRMVNTQSKSNRPSDLAIPILSSDIQSPIGSNRSHFEKQAQLLKLHQTEPNNLLFSFEGKKK